MSSSLALMFLYTVLALLLQALSIGGILMIEPYLDGWSGIVFMTSYLLAFWVAWVIALRLTEPRTSHDLAAQPSLA